MPEKTARHVTRHLGQKKTLLFPITGFITSLPNLVYRMCIFVRTALLGQFDSFFKSEIAKKIPLPTLFLRAV